MNNSQVEKKKKFKDALVMGIRVAVTSGLLVFLLSKVDFLKIIQTVRSADVFYLFLSFFCYILCCWIGILRWRMFLKGSGIHLSLSRVTAAQLLGMFFNLFFPTTIGGDVSKVIHLSARTGNPRSGVMTTVILDRMSGFLGMALMGVLAVIFGKPLFKDAILYQKIVIFISALSFVIIGIFFLLFNKKTFFFLTGRFRSEKTKSAIAFIHSILLGFRRRYFLLFVTTMMSCAIHFLFCVSFYLSAKAIFVNASFLYFLIFVPIINAFVSLPISIGGLGLRDTTTVFLFQKAGISAASSFTISLLNFSFMVVVGLLGGLTYALAFSSRRIQYHPQKKSS